jgi:hypothetical protein
VPPRKKQASEENTRHIIGARVQWCRAELPEHFDQPRFVSCHF